jgi:hypothetical protein
LQDAENEYGRGSAEIQFSAQTSPTFHSLQRRNLLFRRSAGFWEILEIIHKSIVLLGLKSFVGIPSTTNSMVLAWDLLLAAIGYESGQFRWELVDGASA